MTHTIAFTSTRSGMTSKQQSALAVLLALMGAGEFIHGDAKGGDAEADAIATDLGITRRIFPGNIPMWRAYCSGAYIMPEEPPLERNKTMVERCRVLIACPATAAEEQRSGTWATVRHARRTGKPHIIINPDGTIIVPEPT